MAQSEQKRSTALFWVAGFALLVLLIFAIRSLTREQVKVKVAPVSYQTLTNNVPTNGKVEPVEPFQAHAPSAGVVRKIYVNEGDQIVPGQLLVKMDDADAHSRLATANAQLSQARLQQSDLAAGGSTEERSQFSSNVTTATLEQQAATTNLAAVQALNQRGSASANELAAAQARLTSANAALATATSHPTARYSNGDRTNAAARVADAKASVDAAEASVTAVDIRSPYSGTVYFIPVSEYDFVPAGEDLMDVADLHRLQVRAYFDEPEIGKLQVGQPVKIVWAAKPELSWHGHVQRIPTTIIAYQTTRSVGECIITVDDPNGELAPNANVTVNVTVAQRSHVLSIPREALHTDGANNFVYRVLAGKLEQVPVQLGPLVTLTSAEITGGLKENDLVVLGPASPGKELSVDLPVKIVK